MSEALTPPACTKCRTHRVRCDKAQPICGRCSRLGHRCEYPFKNAAAAYMNYVANLEEEIAQLEVELKQVQSIQRDTPQNLDSLNTPSIAGAPGQISSIASNESSRYLGASSGMAFIEAAIHLAQARGILDAPEEDLIPMDPPTVPSHLLDGLIQSRPSLSIPPRDLMQQLFHTFSSAQWQYRILESDEFDFFLDRYYRTVDFSDPVAAAAVHLVFAISLHLSGKNDSNIAASSLADAHHELVMGMLGSIIQHKTLETLQVILLLLLFSMVNPQKPIVWQLLGTALRIASSLRLHTEEGIGMTATEHDTSNDLPRRLFWSLYSMDRAVGNTLGRPTALQDSSITCNLPGEGSLGISAPLKIANHCFRLRQLQSEVADMLYQRTSDLIPNYIQTVQSRLDVWFREIPIQNSDQVLEWFHHSYYNLCMFIHRPSPANPKPSSDDLQRCFDAASRVIQIYTKLDERGSIDTTWMAVHWLFLASITQLYCLWTDENFRREANWTRINDDIQSSTMIFSAMTERWKSGRKMLRIYRRLSKSTLAKYTQIVHMEASSEGGDSTSPGVTQVSMSDIFGLNDSVLDSDILFWFDTEQMDHAPFYCA
ncbi:Fc.00g036750.m01.CDS01 [Cosmosporella sp. VM-42]